MTTKSAPHPTRCPACRRPSRRSHASCAECTRRHGATTAALIARVQSDPQFTSAFLAQLRPEHRERLGSLVMARWLQRRWATPAVTR